MNPLHIPSTIILTMDVCQTYWLTQTSTSLTVFRFFVICQWMDRPKYKYSECSMINLPKSEVYLPWARKQLFVSIPDTLPSFSTKYTYPIWQTSTILTRKPASNLGSTAAQHGVPSRTFQNAAQHELQMAVRVLLAPCAPWWWAGCKASEEWYTRGRSRIFEKGVRK